VSSSPRLPQFAIDRVGGLVLAVSLNGFFLYLGLLDLLSVSPSTGLTACWYAAIGVASIGAAVPHRRVLVRRVQATSLMLRATLAGLCFLGAWFVVNAALLGRSNLAYHFAGLFLLWTFPSALLAFSLPPRLVFSALRLIGALGAGFFVIDVVALARSGGGVQRFSPLEHLDPISAGNICALGAVAVLAVRPRSRLAIAVQLGVVTALLAASAASGSRGPVAAGVVGCLAFLVIKRSWTNRLLVLLALVTAISAGAVLAKSVGTLPYLTDNVAGIPIRGHPHRQIPAISTADIRKRWFKDALSQSVDRPIFGHGVARFVDNTPEAHRMGIAGERTYPHNTFAEAAFSLGLLGVIPYLLAALGTGVALLRVRRARMPTDACVWGLVGFAAVSTAVSGEIGADAVAWAAIGLSLAAAADAGAQSSGSSASSMASVSDNGTFATDR
jgi:O-antigen ligase